MLFEISAQHDHSNKEQHHSALALELLKVCKQQLQQASSFWASNKNKLPFYTIITVVSKHFVINKMKGDFRLVISQGHWTWNDPLFLKGAPKVSYPLQYSLTSQDNESARHRAALCWTIRALLGEQSRALLREKKAQPTTTAFWGTPQSQDGTIWCQQRT